ncbi:MAG: acylphosphatase [Phycisphaerae bacterium]
MSSCGRPSRDALGGVVSAGAAEKRGNCPIVSTDRPVFVVRSRVIYCGRVQGVYFRATARELSRGYRVVGFVRNLADGTVELQAEGARDQIDGFLRAIRDRYEGFIDDETVSDLPPRGDEQTFDVRH